MEYRFNRPPPPPPPRHRAHTGSQFIRPEVPPIIRNVGPPRFEEMKANNYGVYRPPPPPRVQFDNLPNQRPPFMYQSQGNTTSRPSSNLTIPNKFSMDSFARVPMHQEQTQISVYPNKEMQRPFVESKDMSHDGWTSASYGREHITLQDRSNPVNTGTISITQTSGQESDSMWLRQWVATRNIHSSEPRTHKQRKNNYLITEAKELIRQSVVLMEELEEARAELVSLISKKTPMWSETHLKCLAIQKQLDLIQKKITDGNLKQKINCVQKKRERLRRLRQLRYQRKVESNETRKILHDEIDQWQASLRQKELDKKREKEMKAAADATLSEVRKKLSEGSRCLEILEYLSKLRKVRKDAMEQMGLYTPKDTDSNFEKRRDRLKLIMQQQLDTYKAEQAALNLMLEAEAEESKEAVKQETVAKDIKWRRSKTKLSHWLFGKQNTPSMEDEMYPFWNYYMSAQCSLQSFLTIRQEWDCYITKDEEEGSCIPPGWLIPNQPSSDVWKSALKSLTTKL